MQSIKVETILYAITRDGDAPVPTLLTYERSDPYAVGIHMDTGVGVVPWEIERLLLDRALGQAPSEQLVGLGDVRVGTCQCTDGRYFAVHLELENDQGFAVLHGSVEDFDHFLHLTYRSVPYDCESFHTNLDKEIADLLANEP